MGLNYSYVLLLDGRSEQEIWKYLKEQGTLGNNSHDSTYIVLPFELDAVLSEYLIELIKTDGSTSWWKTIQLTEQAYPNHIIGNKGKVGAIDLYQYPRKKGGGSFLCFSAATSRMSVLLQDSSSIKDWFVDTSKKVGAVICFVDLEEQGYKMIYPEKGELLEEATVVQGEEPLHQLLKEYIALVYGEEYLE